jgi:hypothetical protein
MRTMSLGIFDQPPGDDNDREAIETALQHGEALALRVSDAEEDRKERSLGMLAAYGQAMANGGVLGQAAAAVPYVEMVDDATKQYSYPVGGWWAPPLAGVLDFADGTSVPSGAAALYAVALAQEEGANTPDLFHGHIFTGRGNDDFSLPAEEPDQEWGPLRTAIHLHYAESSLSPASPDWGKYVAQKYLPYIREQLGLASYSEAEVRPFLERLIEAETLLYETNVTIGSGIFDGLAPPARVDTVDPLPEARGEHEEEGFGCTYTMSHTIVGLSQEQYDALAAESDADEIDHVTAALSLVAGDAYDQLAAQLADVLVGAPFIHWRSSTVQSKTSLLGQAAARGLVGLLGTLAQRTSSARLRQALRDLADDPKFEGFWSFGNHDSGPSQGDAE